MSRNRQNYCGAPARRLTASVLAALLLALSAISLPAGAVSHALEKEIRGYGSFSFASQVAFDTYGITVGVPVKLPTTLRPYSPYAVKQTVSSAPYRTGAWGTIDRGHMYGVRYAMLAEAAARTGQSRRESASPAAVRERPAEPSVKAPAATEPKRSKRVRKLPGETDGKKKKFIRLFSTVDFRSPLKGLPKWERVIQLERQQPSFTESGLSCGSAQTKQRWLKLKSSLKDASLQEKIKGVNRFFNKWPYRTDKAVWGVEDYWALPCEFIARSGDCEDYAIIKYYALKDLGVPVEVMRVAAVTDTIRGIGHAVLVVYTGDDAYVLDNVSNLVLSHKRLKHYRPLFTVNERYLWRHVKPIAGPDSK